MSPRLLSMLIAISWAAPATAERQTIGVHSRWGAFKENGRCFAMSAPVDARRGSPAAASVGFWPARGAWGQVHVRLGAPRRAGSAVILKIGSRSFQLAGNGAEAWAASPAADGLIVAMMRTGSAMSVETRTERGGVLRERYSLAGAASAVDAAAAACAHARGAAGKSGAYSLD